MRIRPSYAIEFFSVMSLGESMWRPLIMGEAIEHLLPIFRRGTIRSGGYTKPKPFPVRDNDTLEAGQPYPGVGQLFPVRGATYPGAGQLFPVRDNYIPERDNFFRVRDNFLPARDNFFQCGTTISRCGTTFSSAGQLYPGAGQLFPVRDNFFQCGTTFPGAGQLFPASPLRDNYIPMRDNFSPCLPQLKFLFYRLK